MIKRRGKLGLLKVNTDWEGVKTWLAEKRGQETTVCFNLEFLSVHKFLKDVL